MESDSEEEEDEFDVDGLAAWIEGKERKACKSRGYERTEEADWRTEIFVRFMFEVIISFFICLI